MSKSRNVVPKSGGFGAYYLTYKVKFYSLKGFSKVPFLSPPWEAERHQEPIIVPVVAQLLALWKKIFSRL